MQFGTRGNPNANILIVGEAYGAEEERAQKPFVGSSGKELSRMLAEAGIDEGNCYFTNVVNARPDYNEMFRFFIPTAQAKTRGLPAIKGLYPDAKILEGIERLEALIAKLRPRLIICFGNYALWALTESSFGIGDGKGNAKGFKIPTGISNYRGSQLRHYSTGIPLLPTFHPAAIMRQWAWRTLALHDLHTRAPKALKGDWDEPYRQYVVEPSFEEVMEVLTTLRLRAEASPHPLLVANDIETKEGHIECIGFAWSKHHALCVPIMSSVREEGYWSAEEEAKVLTETIKVLEHPNIELVGQNFVYDYQYYSFFLGMRPQYRHDTMLAHHVMFPGTEMGLNYLSSIYCGWHSYWKDDGKEASDKLDDRQRWIYNCRDCVVTWEAIVPMLENIRKYGLQKQYAIQMVRANASIDMMVRGVKVDESRRGEERIAHIEACMELAARLEFMMPTSVWPRKDTPGKKNSPAPWYKSDSQIAEIFYDVLGMSEISNRKTGNRTVNGEALTRIAAREPAIGKLIEALQQWRSLETFGEFLAMKLGPDGRMRCSFSPTTETFRYRSRASALGYGRNMQNIPVGQELEED